MSKAGRGRSNILVTGGAGYIGSVTVTTLIQAGYRVKVFDSLMYTGESLLGVFTNPDFEFVKGDLRNLDQYPRLLDDIDAVVHLAAIVGDPACKRQEEAARAINYEATLALVNMSKEAGIDRFIFASTCSNYGVSHSDVYVDENYELNPVSLYAQTKVESESYILDSSGALFSPTVLRLSTVYGLSPRMRFDLVVNQFTLEAIRNKKLVIFGSRLWRPYIHTRDAAKAIINVLESPEELVGCEVFNVGDNSQNFQKTRIAEFIKNEFPEVEIEVVYRKDDPRSYKVSFDKIRNTLGFSLDEDIPTSVKRMRLAIETGVIQNPDERKYRN